MPAGRQEGQHLSKIRSNPQKGIATIPVNVRTEVSKAPNTGLNSRHSRPGGGSAPSADGRGKGPGDAETTAAAGGAGAAAGPEADASAAKRIATTANATSILPNLLQYIRTLVEHATCTTGAENGTTAVP